jgi:phage recombination protein Bet
MSNQKTQVVEKPVKSLSNEQIQLLIKTVAKGADINELGLFLNVSKRAGLDPFLRQIHLIPRSVKQGDNWVTIRTVQVGIDGYLAIAERTGQLAGIDDAVFDDGHKYEPGKEPINPSKATVTVWRMVQGNRVSFTATARWKEYFPGDKLGFMWKKMPYGQLSKCALSLALRKAFPTDLGGLYTDVEMEQADAIQVKAEAIEPKKEEKKVEAKKEAVFYCYDCDIEISKQVAEFSTKIMGKPYCRECLKAYTPKNTDKK